METQVCLWICFAEEFYWCMKCPAIKSICGLHFVMFAKFADVGIPCSTNTVLSEISGQSTKQSSGNSATTRTTSGKSQLMTGT